MEKSKELIRASKSISKRDKELVLAFVEQYQGRDGPISDHRKKKYAIQLRKVLEWLPCELKDLDEDCFDALMAKIDSYRYSRTIITGRDGNRVTTKKTKGRKLSAASVYDYKVQFKTFLNWLEKKKGFKFPAFEWRIKKPHGEKTAEDIFSPQEVAALRSAQLSTRNKALVEFLLETGVRPKELLALRVKDIHFEENVPYVFLPKTKEGRKREIAIVSCVPMLQEWLAMHPRKGDGNAQLFCKQARWGEYGVMDEPALLRLIKKITQKAGIDSTKAKPYTFRHTAITLWSEQGLNEAVIKYRAGHAPSSNMLSTYTHIRGSEASEAYLKAKGIIQEEKNAEEFIQCPRCGRVNSQGARICSRCGAPLSLEAAAEMQEATQKEAELLSKLLSDSEIYDKLKEKLIEDMMREMGEKVVALEKSGHRNPLSALDKKAKLPHRPRGRPSL
ncbi:MAG: tyrosine-type recombinase/integrase [Deferribacteres bacterium]|nr:tyrosine-type recombinase/integrase [Deferribacteres bacterium]